MKYAVFAVALLALCCAVAWADTASDTQSVTIEVKEVALLKLVANSPSFVVDADAVTAGKAPIVTPTNDTTDIKYTCVRPSAGTTKKITLELDDAVPSGLTLKATTTKGATSGATGQSGVTITTVAADILTAIPTEWTDAVGVAKCQLVLTVDAPATALTATAVGTPFTTTATYTITGS